jgi:antitoxin component YwqK of YwqJK toxin-antitoxin module
MVCAMEPLEVYDETGKQIQRAFYQNDLLVDSVQSFYDNGIIKMETVF